MEAYKEQFIKFMVESDVLKFGDFTLKSGRKSPFFMNAGLYVTGSQLIKLGEEVHGPEDAMIINRDQVLFYENLKPGGKVSQLIQNYKSGNK